MPGDSSGGGWVSSLAQPYGGLNGEGGFGSMQYPTVSPDARRTGWKVGIELGIETLKQILGLKAGVKPILLG